MEAAIYLAEKGHGVTLISSRLHIGETVHQYLRNEYLKKLYNLNVTLLTHFDIGAIKENHVISGTYLSRIPNTELFEEMKGQCA